MSSQLHVFLSHYYNKFCEHKIQKSFIPGPSGTLEHTTHMANIINKSHIKQRSLVISLLNLKNAFGEVHSQPVKVGLLCNVPLERLRMRHRIVFQPNTHTYMFPVVASTY